MNYITNILRPVGGIASKAPEFAIDKAAGASAAVISMVALFALGALGSYIHRTMGPETQEDPELKQRLYYQIFPAIVGVLLAGAAFYKAEEGDLKSIAKIVALSAGCFEHTFLESWGFF